jgi:uncharacterized protein (TIGR00369 family)
MISKEEIFSLITHMYSRQVPFHELIGLNVVSLSPEKVIITVQMRPELVGNPAFQILHGGVTASLLDAAGGMIAMANVIDGMTDLSTAEVQRRLMKLGTIDIRVDYLRPGRGELFTATAHIIRRGNKVAVTRMELHNEKDEEIALGTATYMVG